MKLKASPEFEGDETLQSEVDTYEQWLTPKGEKLAEAFKEAIDPEENDINCVVLAATILMADCVLHMERPLTCTALLQMIHHNFHLRQERETTNPNEYLN